MTAHKPPVVHHHSVGHIEHPTGHHGTHHVADGETGSYHARGGPTEHPKMGAMGPSFPGGAGGGVGRLAKAHRAEKKYAHPK